MLLTDKPGVPALGYHSDSLLPTVLHNLADLFHRLGLDDDLPLPVILVHPIIVERSQVVLARRPVEGGHERRRSGQERSKVGYIGFRQLSIGGRSRWEGRGESDLGGSADREDGSGGRPGRSDRPTGESERGSLHYEMCYMLRSDVTRSFSVDLSGKSDGEQGSYTLFRPSSPNFCPARSSLPPEVARACRSLNKEPERERESVKQSSSSSPSSTIPHHRLPLAIDQSSLRS